MCRDNLISVVMAVYNVEIYLSKAIASVLCQSYRNIELICIDDASEDKSLEILKEHAAKDKRLKIISLPKNRGLAYARNLGIKSALGKYITFVDPDDWIEPFAYEKAISCFGDGIQIVAFGIFIEGCEGKKKALLEKYFNFPFSGRITLNEKIKASLNVTLCNKIFLTDYFLDKEIFCFNGKLYEDQSLQLKYILWAEQAFFMKEKFYHYLQRENSIMGSTRSLKSKRISDRIDNVFDVYLYAGKYGLLLRNKELIKSRYIYNFWQDFLYCEKGQRRILVEHCFYQIEKMRLIFGTVNRNKGLYALAAFPCKIKSFFEKIFSVTKRGPFKIITIFGIEIVWSGSTFVII